MINYQLSLMALGRLVVSVPVSGPLVRKLGVSALSCLVVFLVVANFGLSPLFLLIFANSILQLSHPCLLCRHLIMSSFCVVFSLRRTNSQI